VTELPVGHDEDEDGDALSESEKTRARDCFFELLEVGAATLPGYIQRLDAASEKTKQALLDAGKTERQAIGAVNQYRGMWFEMIVVHDWFRVVEVTTPTREDPLVAIPMPKRTELRLESLWVDPIHELVLALECDLQSHKTVMRASNPDLILLRASVLQRHCPSVWSAARTASSIQKRHEALDQIAHQLKGKLDYPELAGMMSLKTSLRVDRKVQPLQEANRIKTLRKYIRTRIWQRHDSPFGFYVVLMEESRGRTHSGSPEAFYSNVLLYSIVSIDEKPSPAVDGVLRITSLGGLEAAINMVHAHMREPSDRPEAP